MNDTQPNKSPLSSLLKRAAIKYRILQIGLSCLLGLALAGALALYQTRQDETRTEALRAAASAPANTDIGGAFNLINQDKQPVSDATYRGKFLLVYFGYTFCPDMCPTGLQSIARALDKLGDQAVEVQPLFITIDPARDTPEKLKEYAATFHPQIVSLTGSAEQIASAAKAYKIYYKKSDEADGDNYMMDHSALIFFMDKEGKFIETFAEEVDPVVMAEHIKAKMPSTKAAKP